MIPLPTVLEMAGNFAGAMARFAGSGFQVVGEAEYLQRLGTCQACQAYGKIGGLFHGCRLCGCGTIKLHLACETCPKRKWRTV